MERPATYQTKQREAVLAYIISLEGGHATAAQIAAYFKQQRITVGRTTIYRHLEQLTKDGKIRRSTVDGASAACYQYLSGHTACRDHFHLKCENCGVLQHLHCDKLRETQRHILDEHTFLIDVTKTVFYGKCDRCLQAQPGL